MVQLVHAQQVRRRVARLGVEEPPRDLGQADRVAGLDRFVEHLLGFRAVLQLVRSSALGRHLADQSARLGLQAAVDRFVLVGLEKEILRSFENVSQQSNGLAKALLLEQFLGLGEPLHRGPIDGEENGLGLALAAGAACDARAESSDRYSNPPSAQLDLSRQRNGLCGAALSGFRLGLLGCDPRGSLLLFGCLDGGLLVLGGLVSRFLGFLGGGIFSGRVLGGGLLCAARTGGLLVESGECDQVASRLGGTHRRRRRRRFNRAKRPGDNQCAQYF